MNASWEHLTASDTRNHKLFFGDNTLLISIYESGHLSQSLLQMLTIDNTICRVCGAERLSGDSLSQHLNSWHSLFIGKIGLNFSASDSKDSQASLAGPRIAKRYYFKKVRGSTPILKIIMQKSPPGGAQVCWDTRALGLPTPDNQDTIINIVAVWPRSQVLHSWGYIIG